jgi:hypothetical protein
VEAVTVVTRPGEDIWEAAENYMVVPINLNPGVLGAGMAKTLKILHPHAVRSHRIWCEDAPCGWKKKGGDILCSHYRSPGGAQIIMMATKEDRSRPSRIEWVERGLCNLRGVIQSGATVALPLLGCGRGGLAPIAVTRVIRQVFAPLQDKIAIIYPDHVGHSSGRRPNGA